MHSKMSFGNFSHFVSVSVWLIGNIQNFLYIQGLIGYETYNAIQHESTSNIEALDIPRDDGLSSMFSVPVGVFLRK